MNHVLEWQKLQDGETNNNTAVAIVKTELPASLTTTVNPETLPKSTRNKRQLREAKDFSRFNNHLLMIAPNQMPAKAMSEDMIKKEVADDVFSPSSAEHPMQKHNFPNFLYTNVTERQRNPLPNFNSDICVPTGTLERRNSLSIQIDGKLSGELTSSSCKPHLTFQEHFKPMPTSKLGRTKRKSRNSYPSDDNMKKKV